MYESVRKHLCPIHPEGYIFIAAFAVVTLILFGIWTPLGWLGTLLTLWCLYFFRDPKRVVPTREGLVISPADGRVCAIEDVMPPEELGLGSTPMTRVSIFMSVFDCHVNRSPVTGKIDRIIYKPGLFINADLDKASEHNERNSFVIETEYGTFGVVQIAGLIARRIVCFVNIGTSILAGNRIGLIRFGSRVDVYMPGQIRILVGVGAKMVGGETILADMRLSEDQRDFRVS